MLRAAFALLAPFLVAQASLAQSPQTIEKYRSGPYTGPVEQALVLVEVVNDGKDGKPLPVRRGIGLLSRCDGFVLVPSDLFEEVRKLNLHLPGPATISVTVRPGTPEQKRYYAMPPTCLDGEAGFAACKLKDFFAPAARLLLADEASAGLRAVWLDDSPQHGVHSAGITSIKYADKPGRMVIDPPLTNVPAGTVVARADGEALAAVPGRGVLAKVERVADFRLLHRATNCVSVRPAEARRGGTAQKAEMVKVPGGPLVLPGDLPNAQPDMAREQVACVAEFEIDKYQVTNDDYLRWLQSLPEADLRARQAVLWPIAWAEGETPYPPSIGKLPVLGVRLPAAMEYAQAQGKRLPTPYEWCRAALGSDYRQTAPDWMERYLADRRSTSERVWARHQVYWAANLNRRLGPYDEFPDCVNLPWFFFSPEFQGAAEFSQTVCRGESQHIWNDWVEPEHIVPVGLRTFDVSPYGAHDMVMNGGDIILPSPGLPTLGEWRSITVAWIGSDQTFRNQFPLGPLSMVAKSLGGEQTWMEKGQYPWISRRLDWRQGYIGNKPANRPDFGQGIMFDEATSEVVEMVRPLSGWKVVLPEGPAFFYKPYTGLFPYMQAFVSGPYFACSSFELWRKRPEHAHQEMGVPIPWEQLEQPYQPFVGKSKQAPYLRLDMLPAAAYLTAAGFRCAR